MPTTVFQPVAEMSSTLARKDAPALLTITSRRPISFTVRSTSALTWSSCRTSTATQKERRPSLVISAVTGSRFSSLRLAITTSAPARANSSAMDLPMPTPPPVTMATLSSIENGDAAMTPPGLPLSPQGRGQGEGWASCTTSDDRAVYTQSAGGGGGSAALTQRPVHAPHAADLERGLERPLHGLGLGEDQRARRLAIEPVDDEGPGLLRPLLRSEIVPEQAIGGPLALALGRDREQARGLDHHQHRVVLVHQGEAARERRARPAAQGDDRVRRDLQAAVAAGAPVDHHPSGLEPLLEAPAGGRRGKGAQ